MICTKLYVYEIVPWCYMCTFMHIYIYIWICDIWHDEYMNMILFGNLKKYLN